MLTIWVTDVMDGPGGPAGRTRRDPTLVGLPLAQVRYRVVASPDYLNRHGRPRAPADLARCECLRLALPGFRSQSEFRQTVAPRHDRRDEPALLPDWLIGSDLAGGTLLDLFPRHEASAGGFDSAVWLLYPRRDALPRRVRLVADFLKARLGTV